VLLYDAFIGHERMFEESFTFFSPKKLHISKKSSNFAAQNQKLAQP